MPVVTLSEKRGFYMPQAATQNETASSVENLEQQIRARIDSLSYLPTTAAVAMKFVELGKNLDAEPSDYAKVISAHGPGSDTK